MDFLQVQTEVTQASQRLAMTLASPAVIHMADGLASTL